MYNAHFRFRESPFGVTPDPQFYYSNAANSQAWVTLRHGIEERLGLMLLVGEPGTGKTTLLQKLLLDFNSRVDSAYLSQPAITQTSLLGAIAKDIGLPAAPGHNPPSLEQIHEFLVDKHKAGRTVVVLIDEAQGLSLSCLEEVGALDDLKIADKHLLQIVLVGHPELEEHLDRPELRALKQHIALRCVLKPLTADEIGPYIDARLQTIGHRGAELFEPEAVERVAAFSQGIPRVINVLCDHALLVAYVLSSTSVNASMVNEVAEDLGLEETPEAHIALPQSSLLTEQPEDEIALKQKMFAIGVSDPPRERGAPFSGKVPRYGLAALLGSAAIAAGVFIDWHNDVFFGLKSSANITAAPPRPLEAPLRSSELSTEPQARAVHAETKMSAIQSEPAPLSETDRPSTQPPEPANVPDAIAQPATEKVPAKTSGDIEKTSEKTQRANFVVVGRSFVRARPTSSAEIVATLEPGADISVAGRTGEYFRVRAAGPEAISGYVHREDAFFERKR